MKRVFFILATSILALRSPAQTNAPLHLGLISETGEAMPASDVLTAQLSGDPQINLLERNEIESVYREQGLSAANQDYLKLGHILGADGLLLFNVVRTRQATNLTMRLIAVKPGVILTDGSFNWPLKDLSQWSESTATYLKTFLPKLTVLPNEAIPISVVNLRSATASKEAAETERQLKLLTIQRLSQEPQLFVLERQNMQALSEEKNLNADNSAFWNGSYLLDGVVDQNGFSPDIITISAHLTPPHGGAPIAFEIRGSRTNYSEVVQQLAVKVNKALKINSSVKEWNAVDEAAQYFNEAQWALKWGAYSEAQAAAESAWALGKQDMDNATIRVKSYADATGRKIIGEGGIDRSLANSAEETDRDWVVRSLKRDTDHYPGIVYSLDAKDAYTPVISLQVYNSPTLQSLNHSIRALSLYRDFSQTLSAAEPANHSAWYDFGIDNLTMASEVLQHFYLVPNSQNGEADKLAELRALSRSIAAWISKSPEVRDRYNQCKMTWGCFWQEKPEDGVIFYRDYLTNPTLDSSSFARFQEDLRAHELDRPRLISWNENDRKRAAIIWENLVRELGSVTNQFLQAEAIVLKKIEFSGLNAEEIIPKYLAYWQGLRVRNKTNLEPATTASGNDQKADDVFSQPGQILQKQEESRQLKAHQVKQQWEAARHRSEFEQRINYLNTQTILDPISFGKIMFNFDYSPEEAGELLPILTNYEARITESKQGHTGNTMQVFEHKLQNIKSPPWRKSTAPAPVVNQTTLHNHESTQSPQPPAIPAEIATNILFVNNFYKIPQEQFWENVLVWPGQESRHGIHGEQVWKHSWQDGKLMLAVKYSCSIINSSYKGENIGAAAILDPTNSNWETILYPRNPADSQHEVTALTMFQNNLYLVDDELVINEGNHTGHKTSIKIRNRKTAQWETLAIQFPDNFEQKTIYQGPPQLFVINDHLYAANFESIFEITDNGHGTRILASTRRRPAASALDSLSDLGSPTLFSGPSNSLRASIGSKLYSRDGTDWQEIFDFGFVPQVDVFEDGVFFRNGVVFFPYAPPGLQDRHYNIETLWILRTDQFKPELCLYEKAKNEPGRNQQRRVEQIPKAMWQFPEDHSLINLAAMFYKSNLYFFVDHAIVTNVSDQYHWTVAEKDGYHAQLVCLSPDCPYPIVVPLKFDLKRGQAPLKSLADKMSDLYDPQLTWLFCGGDMLYMGQKLTLGVWGIPITEVEAAVATQIQIQLKQREQAAAAIEQAQKDFLAKYDLNHNGTIDPEEKEEALDDPAFIKSGLDKIDVNQNGWLDIEELVYFDANQNKILEAKEQAGIEIANHLLAERLMEQLDQNGKGFLYLGETLPLQHFGEEARLQQSGVQSIAWQSPVRPIFLFDTNHDGRIDLEELEAWLAELAYRSLQLHRNQRYHQSLAPGSDFSFQSKSFKKAVETYWQFKSPDKN